jgi:hypothetical protein
MNPPRAKPEPASLFRGTRSGSLQDQVQKCMIRGVFRDHLEVVAVRTSPTVSSRAALLPSHIPSDGLLVGRTPDRARGPLFIFRKIHLYGKTKKSTHGHQTAKPFCTHFWAAGSTDATGHGGFNGAGLAAVRGPWRPAGPFKVGYRVGGWRGSRQVRPTYPAPQIDLPYT